MKAIQLGILPELDREVKPNIKGYLFRMLVAARAVTGEPDKSIAARAGRSPQRSYKWRARMGMKRYRTDEYVRAPRQKANHENRTT